MWKGKDYRGGGIFQARVLVVGESTYTNPEHPKDTSQYNLGMALDHKEGTHRDAFRTKLLRAFLGRREERNGTTSRDVDAFWDSVAYFNYITTPLASARKAPSERQWLEEHEEIPFRLDELRPHIVIVLGGRMWEQWNAYPPCTMEIGPVVPGAWRSEMRWLVARESRALAYCLKHPSSGFSWSREHPFLMEAIQIAVLERAGRRRS